jgi:putative hydrolase of the HAD superfamily
VSALAGVLFDMGGVVMESPLAAIAGYEQAQGLPPTSINRVVRAAGETGAWARLERGELTVATFCAPFEADCRAHGVAVDAAALMRAIAAAGRPRPAMLEAIRRLRAHGLRVGALTNNWHRGESKSAGESTRSTPAPPGGDESLGGMRGHVGAPHGDDVIPHALRAHFDVFVESRAVGLRKPDPRIYALACGELGVAPARTVFLDDIGANLKPARALGMTTIKVDEPTRALRELGTLLGLDLLGSAAGDAGSVA